jgi:hypothetical protein
MSSSLCNGVGVNRSRSVPRGTVADGFAQGGVTDKHRHDVARARH